LPSAAAYGPVANWRASARKTSIDGASLTRWWYHAIAAYVGTNVSKPRSLPDMVIEVFASMKTDTRTTPLNVMFHFVCR